jgi:hypothetical protein
MKKKLTLSERLFTERTFCFIAGSMVVGMYALYVLAFVGALYGVYMMVT